MASQTEKDNLDAFYLLLQPNSSSLEVNLVLEKQINKVKQERDYLLSSACHTYLEKEKAITDTLKKGVRGH